MNEKDHKNIAEYGYELVKGPYIKEEIIKTCMYPDIYADRNVSLDLKEYLWPLPPKSNWYKKLLKKIEKNPVKILSYHPVEYIYLILFYFKNVIGLLKKKNFEKASQFSGIFSHFIGDFLQPIHTLNPSFIDFLIDVPEKYLPYELHYTIESITTDLKFKKYRPEILGENIKKATLKLYTKIYNYTEQIRKDTLKMISFLYKNDDLKIKKYAQIAVLKSCYLFSDFLYTSIILSNKNKIKSKNLSLIDYPYISCDIDMLYRYRVQKNISLIPYSQKAYPLKLKINNEIKEVNGISVFPYVGPIISGEKKERDAKVEYFILPGTFKKFKAMVGLNPCFKNSSGKVVFRIFSNDKIIFQTKKVKPDDSAILIEIDLPKDTIFLTLSMLTIEEPKPPIWINHPHGIWAEPELI
ncbi:MAG: NPCBM/NEW2 domain-containing protein [Candidatus Omnitrophica bacterium]|nr:NPCBM/NEW2 domain-containing protein [Candidatus Omnitrophota bacterium]